MRRETGCRYVMVGHGALADPWIFSGRQVESAEAARFLFAYSVGLAARGSSPVGVAGRLKQLLAHWTAGGLLGLDRRAWLREADPLRLLERLREEAHLPALLPH
jgi:tRNA-dihydrouridine synthase